MSIAVIGAGYVGLTTAACLAHLGHEVVCADIDAERVARLRKGEVPILEDGLPALIAEGLAVEAALVRRRRAAAAAAAPTSCSSACRRRRATTARPTSRSSRRSPARSRRCSRRTRSSSTSRRCRSARRGSCSGCSPRPARRASDVTVASNPEFLREGQAVRDFLQPRSHRDRLRGPGVGGARVASCTAACTRRCSSPIPASAEMIKYASNAFLATKISFINAIANLCEAVDADVREVAIGMGYDARIGFQFLHPGPGLRRLVLPEGRRRAAAHRARGRATTSSCSTASSSVNRGQHERIVDKVRAAAGGTLAGADGRRCGASRSRPTPTTCATRRRSSIARQPARGGRDRARPTTRPRASGRGRLMPELDVRADAYEAAAGADVVALLTEWDEFRWLDFDRVRDAMRGRAIVDARNLLDPAAMRRRGLRVQRESGAGRWPDRRHRRCRLRRLAPVRRVARARRRGRRGRQPRRPAGARTSRTSPSARASSWSSPTSSTEIPVDGPGRRRAALREPGEPARVPRDAARDARRRARSARAARSTSRARTTRAFLLASTSEIYGDPLVHPQPETYNGNVDPDRAARGLRRGEALRRDAHDDVPPALRPADARSCASSTRTARACARPTVASSRTSSCRRSTGEPLTIYGDGHADAVVLLRRRRGARASSRSSTRDDRRAGQHRQPDRVHDARARRARARGRRRRRSELVFEPLPDRRPDAAPARHHAGRGSCSAGSRRSSCAKVSSARTPGTWRSAPVDERDRTAAEDPQALGHRAGLQRAQHRRRDPAPHARGRAARRHRARDHRGRRRQHRRHPRRAAPARRQHRARRDARREPRQGRGGAHRLRARDRRLRARSRTPTSSTTPRTGRSCSRRCCAGRARVVYGSRFTGERRNMLFLHWIGNRFLSLVTNVLYNTTLSDMETCYKLVDRDAARSTSSCAANRFDIEPEITAKILKRGIRIYEVPISYTGPRVRRGQEDHVARRLRGVVDAGQVPLCRLTPNRIGRAGPPSSSTTRPATAARRVRALGARRHERGRRSSSSSSTTARPTARSTRCAPRVPDVRVVRAPGQRRLRARREPRHRGDQGADRRGAQPRHRRSSRAPRRRCCDRLDARAARSARAARGSATSTAPTTRRRARSPSVPVAVGHGLLGLWWPTNPFTDPVPPARRRPVGAAARSTGCRAPRSGCGAPRSTRSAAGTSATSCTSRTSTSAGGCARAGWDVAYEPAARRRRTCRARARRAGRTGCSLEHHRSAWRFAQVRLTGVRAVLLPFAAVYFALRAVLAMGDARVAGIRPDGVIAVGRGVDS